MTAFSVIPGRAQRVRAKRGPMGAGPESITPAAEYGFRVRRFAAPRNDMHQLGKHS